jgi:hypothetical protein
MTAWRACQKRDGTVATLVGCCSGPGPDVPTTSVVKASSRCHRLQRLDPGHRGPDRPAEPRGRRLDRRTHPMPAQPRHRPAARLAQLSAMTECHLPPLMGGGSRGRVRWQAVEDVAEPVRPQIRAKFTAKPAVAERGRRCHSHVIVCQDRIGDSMTPPAWPPDVREPDNPPHSWRCSRPPAEDHYTTDRRTGQPIVVRGASPAMVSNGHRGARRDRASSVHPAARRARFR